MTNVPDFNNIASRKYGEGTVLAVSRKEFLAAAKASPECHEEVRFAVVATAEGEATVPKVLNGTIDSVFREAAGWSVVDYKTDVDATAAILQKRYGAQLAAYVSTLGTWLTRTWYSFIEAPMLKRMHTHAPK